MKRERQGGEVKEEKEKKEKEGKARRRSRRGMQGGGREGKEEEEEKKKEEEEYIPVLASTGFFKSKVTLIMVQIISSLSLFEAYCRHFSTTLLANLCWEKSRRFVCTSLIRTALSASQPCCITN